MHLTAKLPSITALALCLCLPAMAAEIVTVDNFTRAETDEIMKSYVESGGFGEFSHIRVPTPLDEQNVIRMNLDTLYSFGVFDLTNPVTITKPESDGRFQSMLVINQDHSMLPVIHEAGEFTYTQEQMGTRYMIVVIRTFADSTDEADVAAANALQDKLIATQDSIGTFEIPEWDTDSLSEVRDAVLTLALTRVDTKPYFGDKEKLNPLYHLLGTAVGWGGNPPEAAMYAMGLVDKNDGTPYTVTVKDVPVDGFWSLTVYNKEGFMEPNDLGVNAYNNVTAAQNDDGSYTINFGGCDDGRINCIPITDGWNYAVRQYQPQQVIIDGEWNFPKAEVAE
jgi:hypothetical protein